MPGDLITIAYPKENLNRTPFRILKISAGASFRTAVISAQYHDDLWFSDEATGIVAARAGKQDRTRDCRIPWGYDRGCLRQP